MGRVLGLHGVLSLSLSPSLFFLIFQGLKAEAETSEEGRALDGGDAAEPARGWNGLGMAPARGRCTDAAQVLAHCSF